MGASVRCEAALLAGLFALSACATPETVDAAAAPVELAVEASIDCTPPALYGGYLFWMDDPSVRPGSDVRMTPWYSPQPGVMDPVPEGCLSIHEISGPGSLLEDGRTVRVDADAPEGQAVFVNGTVGEARISGRIVVYRPESLPLVGFWSQRSEECEGREPMRELSFSGDGTFTATWMPFEVYRDYWGRFSYDTASGELVLTPEGGNYVPDDALLGGIVAFGGKTLEVPPGFFGSPYRGARCDAPFRR